MAKHKKNKNEMVAARTLGPSSDFKNQDPEPRDVEGFIGIAAQIAESTVYCGNWKYKNAEKHFPYAPLMRTVDKYFPHAHGGPLFVDQPTTEEDEEVCKKKARALKQEGLRYVYITKEMTLKEAMEQMKENGF